MNRKIIYTAIALLVITLVTEGQGTGSFLRQVGSSHPAIKHYVSILEAHRAESVTGNTPGELTAGFGYFPGTPDAIGLKRTFEAAQSFEFPTTYILRGKLSREAFSVAETEYEAGRINLLLEAKLLAYDYIALVKSVALLSDKEQVYNLVRAGWEVLLQEGSVTILEYNRLLLELSRARSEKASEEAALVAMKVRLDYISDGNAELLDGANYDTPEKPELESLLGTRKKLHPAFILQEKEYALSLREVDLTRAGNLPGFEIGFGSELIAGEHHTGPKVGVSIPVWTNRNKVKLAQARSAAAGAGKDAALAMLISETEADYEYYQRALKNYETTAGEISYTTETDHLDTALNEREITLTDYFSFMESVYEAKATLITLENDYYKALARLLDHTLAGY